MQADVTITMPGTEVCGMLGTRTYPPICTEPVSSVQSVGGAQNGTFCRASYLLANAGATFGSLPTYRQARLNMGAVCGTAHLSNLGAQNVLTR